jgi:hypothetical protein
LAAGAEDFWLIFTLLGVTMSQKSSVPQRRRSVSGVMTPDSYHYESHDQLRAHLAAFVGAYNFAKRLKALAGLTPFEAICKAWAKEPQRFRLSPDHLTSGLHS